jgi:hypothetical protein
MADNFTLDSKGIAAIAVGPEVAAAVLAVVEKAKAIAEGLSIDFVETGDYIGSFEASVEIQELPAAGRSPSHRAAVGLLVNTSDHAVAVEYGFKGRSDAPTRKAHRVLGRTLAALEAE